MLNYSVVVDRTHCPEISHFFRLEITVFKPLKPLVSPMSPASIYDETEKVSDLLYLGFIPGRGHSIGWSLQKIIKDGLPDREGPETFSDLLDLLLSLFKESESEWSGSVALNSIDVLSAPLIRKEGLTKDQVETKLYSFISSICEMDLNTTMSLDLIPDEELSETYNAYQTEIDVFNQSFSEAISLNMEKGHFNPIPVINIHDDELWENPILDAYLALSFQYGQPLIQNMLNGIISSEPIRPESQEPYFDVPYMRLGGSVGNADNRGVLGYVCINLEEIATLAESEPNFFTLLDNQIDEATNILVEHKENLIENIRTGGMPLTNWFMDDSRWLYSAISIVGMNEALKVLINAPLAHIAGKAVTYQLLEFLLNKIESVQLEKSVLFTVESHPSEYPGALMLSESISDTKFLTAATDLSPHHGNELWDALEHQKKFDSMYTGGTLQQVFLSERLTYHEGCKLLVRRIIETFGFSYFAITPYFSLCPEHGYLSNGEDPIQCEKCKPYTRVDGIIQAVETLPESLKEVYRTRVHLDVKNR
jgi:anaerobic ribonucleoside-triphosphate reductase